MAEKSGCGIYCKLKIGKESAGIESLYKPGTILNESLTTKCWIRKEEKKEGGRGKERGRQKEGGREGRKGRGEEGRRGEGMRGGKGKGRNEKRKNREKWKKEKRKEKSF